MYYKMVYELLVQILRLYGSRTSVNFGKFTITDFCLCKFGEKGEKLERNPQICEQIEDIFSL